MLNDTTRQAASLEAVLCKEDLRAAWLAVKANGGAAGVDGRDIEESEIA